MDIKTYRSKAVHFSQVSDWNWQAQKISEQFGLLLYNDLRLELSKHSVLLSSLRNRIRKAPFTIMNIFKTKELS